MSETNTARVTTIQENQPICTMINTLTVKPENQQKLLDYLRAMTEEVVVTAPGFISANFHLSQDGTKIINYAQWRSLADLQAMLAKNPHHVKQCNALAENIEIRTDLTVAYCAYPSEALVH
ncbi:antibiotic biosynthesis monooxygenase [Ktedonobacter sp. SOSP1-52]|uniref:antibiotic biosynthesis monooxygenase family protein n=1 Tax=Ktedonobacter sp. SOSP1-52 TaxID=2778366 RepID=UPI001916BF59|nr:antibiotic biosynthesis monooxygenase family protein [Ktedonobacter sp. SOSP1-52]GHO61416.1 antibiotic biosynthesis monooxygenase [Ktedonobacter sp. SOSP1-52]